MQKFILLIFISNIVYGQTYPYKDATGNIKVDVIQDADGNTYISNINITNVHDNCTADLSFDLKSGNCNWGFSANFCTYQIYQDENSFFSGHMGASYSPLYGSNIALNNKIFKDGCEVESFNSVTLYAITKN